jgi:enoyl-CoA hydratase
MPLRVEVENHIAVITIDNPPLNVFPAEFSAQLPEIFDSFADDRDVRVVVVTGSGDRSFTAGADFKEMPFADKSRRARRRLPRNSHESILDCAVPVIVAVNGYCLGHGIGIVSAADIVIASTNASFGLPEINIGAANGYRRIRDFLPRGHARWAYYSGEYVSAEEAYRVGAVYSLERPEDLMPKAMSMAAVLAEKSPRALRLFKDTVKWTEEMGTQLGYRFEGEMFQAFMRDPAAVTEQEKVRQAFIAKRKPEFD